MPNEIAGKQKYDLEERTAAFGETIIDYVKKVPKNTVTIPILRQLIRSGTSIGANYCEADCAETKRDFIHKIGIANKESKETKHWLRMVARALPETIEEVRRYWIEATELNMIFTKIIKTSKKNNPTLDIRN